MSEVVRLYRYKSLLGGRRAVLAEELIAALEISRATFKRDMAKRIRIVHAGKRVVIVKSFEAVAVILPLFSVLLKPPLCGLPVLLLGRRPVLLKRHRADVAQRRVQSLVVVKS